MTDKEQEIYKKARELKGAINEYLVEVNETNPEQMKEQINGRFAGVVGWLTKDFNLEATKLIFDLALDSKMKMQYTDDKKPKGATK